ncbi:MAG: DUF983 domain-containing protein [Alphaproteobacteria bacterium]|nr:DUF983 domain-containing protein [Alphaproteobacteria bacterium]
MAETPNRPPSPLLSGLRLRCPNCGKGRLFRGYLTLAESCAVCGEDFGALEQGDGPAVFVTLVAGFLVIGLALWVEIRFTPPFWVHAALWVPLTLAVTLAMLPPLKGLLAGAHFRHRKGEVERG